MQDRAGLQGKFIVHKFSDRESYKSGKPFDRSEFRNVLLDEGITKLINLLVGGSTAGQYSSSIAWMGVGDSTASSGVSTSTGLLSTANYLYVAVSSITISSHVVTWRSVFTSAQANFNWREFSLKNSSVSTSHTGDNLNRAVSNQGTKASGQTWTLDLQLTIT